MLTIPDSVTIQMTDPDGKPVRQENVLVGIRTFATSKNDITLSPFVSGQDGKIEITRQDLMDAADDFISYGIMDYSSLVSANPTIEIYLWTNQQLDRYINYWEQLLESKGNRGFSNDSPLKMLEGSQRELMMESLKAIENKEREQLDKYKSCCNKDLDAEFTNSIKDNWDGREKAYRYEMKIKKGNRT